MPSRHRPSGSARYWSASIDRDGVGFVIEQRQQRRRVAAVQIDCGIGDVERAGIREAAKRVDVDGIVSPRNDPAIAQCGGAAVAQGKRRAGRQRDGAGVGQVSARFNIERIAVGDVDRALIGEIVGLDVERSVDGLGIDGALVDDSVACMIVAGGVELSVA